MYKFDCKLNLNLLMDFYELTMSNGYLKNDLGNTICVFDMFFRKNPDNAGFSIFCGLEQFIQYINNLKFSDEDILFLKNKNMFCDEFLDYLKNFKFSCDIYSLKEGSVIFPNEPIVTVKGPVIQTHLIETMLLLTINHQSLISTKANRIVRSACGKTVFELGSRRAQGYDGAIYGSRAAYIGGVDATSCTLSEKYFNIPAIGTMSHSWVQLHENEYEAFKNYASTYPDNCMLLIDTYDTLNSGIINAIKVFKEVILPLNKKPVGVRIDSGDLAYLSKKVRKILDENSFDYVKIILTNSLDEYLIKELISQDAKADIFGVGENLITSKSEPVFGGVYKLVAIEKNKKIIPKIKISESIEKITNPGIKKVYRIICKRTNKYLADYICLNDENINTNIENITIFDPDAIWNKKTFNDIYLEELLLPIFKNGKLVYNIPSIKEVKEYCKNQVNNLNEEIKRFEYPQKYYVSLSENLYNLKAELLQNKSAIK